MHPNVGAAALLGFAVAYTAWLYAAIGWLGLALLWFRLVCPAWLVAAPGFAVRSLALFQSLAASPIALSLRI